MQGVDVIKGTRSDISIPTLIGCSSLRDSLQRSGDLTIMAIQRSNNFDYQTIHSAKCWYVAGGVFSLVNFFKDEAIIGNSGYALKSFSIHEFYEFIHWHPEVNVWGALQDGDRDLLREFAYGV
jgi:hypothetical protein